LAAGRLICDLSPLARHPVGSRDLPHIVGAQAAGSVVAVGDGVTGFRVGDRVVTVGADGAYAELRIANPKASWLVPPGLASEEAACVPIEFGTADDCLFEFGGLLMDLQELLERDVDVVTEIGLRPRVAHRVLVDAVEP